MAPGALFEFLIGVWLVWQGISVNRGQMVDENPIEANSVA